MRTDTGDTSDTDSPLVAALAMTVDGGHVEAEVHDGFDVFGTPHGGYLAALAAQAVLLVDGAPDVFTTSVHYLRRAAVGPLAVEVTRVGGSRRFATHHVVARQEGQVVLTALTSVGDRDAVTGPTWGDTDAWDADAASLGPAAGAPDLPFEAPAIAARFGLRLDMATAGFALGDAPGRGALRARMATGHDVDQLAALVACDITPPAVWNVLGPGSWVPTVELTAHVRARPAPGPLDIEVATHHVADGFLEEDALVRDATGRLVVQSRQLARTPTGA